MKILGIDTATPACSAALGIGDNVIQLIEIQPTGHSKILLSMVESLLAEAAINLQSLDAIAIDIGPGSFTGLRIGLGVAQGLAYGANIPVIEISSLKALAIAEKSGFILPAIDARMNQIYCGLYRITGHGTLEELSQPVVSDLNSIPFEIPPQTTGVGSGWDIYEDRLKLNLINPDIQIQHHCNPEAKNGVQLAMHMGLTAAKSPELIEPAYVRNKVVNQSGANTKR